MALTRIWSAPGLSVALGHCRRPLPCLRLRVSSRHPLSTSVHARSTGVPVTSVTAAPYVDTVNVLSQEPLSSFNRYRALVLDTSYRPIDIVPWQRAICLDLFDKVDVLEYYDALVHSARAEFMIPAVLRVRMYVQRDNRGKISLTKRNLLLRDNSTCQYCGAITDLTVDHITPVSKGGLWEWSNLVTACNTCNGRKGSKTLKQLGWKLKKMPVAPSSWQVGILVGPEVNVKCTPKEWADYLFPGHKEAAATSPTLPQLDPVVSII